MVPVFQAAVGKFLEKNPDSPHYDRINILEMAFNGMSNKHSAGTPRN
jgi:hypothetical protein